MDIYEVCVCVCAHNGRNGKRSIACIMWAIMIWSGDSYELMITLHKIVFFLSVGLQRNGDPAQTHTETDKIKTLSSIIKLNAAMVCWSREHPLWPLCVLRLEGKVTARPMEFCESESRAQPDNRVPELKLNGRFNEYS